jgi:hypothetical protein
MRVVCNLMHKLIGLLKGDNTAMEAYYRMFQLPLTDDMDEAIVELNRWSLTMIRGCSPPMMGMMGGHPRIGFDLIPHYLGCLRGPNVIRTYGNCV